LGLQICEREQKKMKKTNGWQNPRSGLKDFLCIADKAKEGEKKETIPLYIQDDVTIFLLSLILFFLQNSIYF